MSRHPEPEAITIRTTRIPEIDALATATDRSRDDIVNQAIEQFLDAHRWQMDRIIAGISAAHAGEVTDAEDVFARIAAKHGWKE